MLKARFAMPVAEIAEGTPEAEVRRALTETSLFYTQKIVVIRGFLEKHPEPDVFLKSLSRADAAAANDPAENAPAAGIANIAIFIEKSLDKRKNSTKAILADKSVVVQEFAVPAGTALIAWIQNRAKTYGLTFGNDALKILLERVGADSNDIRNDLTYDLWLLDNELKKLSTFAGGAPLTKNDVAALIPEQIGEDVFAIANALTDKNKTQAMRLITEYLDKIPGTDEKAKIIFLSAIMAEQFRGMYMVAQLQAERANDQRIAKVTGFTPGKVFVYKRISQKFTSKKFLEILTKLELLDRELKTSSSPAALQFLLIFMSAMQA